MLLELGPFPAGAAWQWTKFARRILLELEADQTLIPEMSADAVDLWQSYVNQWATIAEADSRAERPFRWQIEIEPDVADFLMHSLDQCLHSDRMGQRVTRDELASNYAFTAHVVKALVDGLAEQGQACEHYADHAAVSLGAPID